MTRHERMLRKEPTNAKQTQCQNRIRQVLQQITQERAHLPPRARIDVPKYAPKHNRVKQHAQGNLSQKLRRELLYNPIPVKIMLLVPLPPLVDVREYQKARHAQHVIAQRHHCDHHILRLRPDCIEHRDPDNQVVDEDRRQQRRHVYTCLVVEPIVYYTYPSLVVEPIVQRQQKRNPK